MKANMNGDFLNDNEFKIRVLNELTKLDSKVERLSSHLESEVGNQERAMGRIEKAVEVVAGGMRQENEKLHDSLTELHRSIFVGDGKPSLITRLDRLEQRSDSRGRHVALLWATVLSIVATILGEYIVDRLNQTPKPPISQSTRP
jgi:hypothetical protein